MTTTPFKRGDNVKYRDVHGNIYTGSIEGVLTVFTNQGTKCDITYSILTGNQVFQISDYDVIGLHVQEDFSGRCTCGAEAAAHPHKPSGHATYCDSLNAPTPSVYDMDHYWSCI